MNIFDYTDYKEYFNFWVSKLPNDGRGEYSRLAHTLNVSTTMISQVFNGDKHLSLELTSALADYLNLDDNETDYLFLLVEYARAGSQRLKEKLERRIKTLQNKMQKLENRLKKDKELTEDSKQIFYSSWMYAAVRNIIAIPEVNDAQTISERLNIPRGQVIKILDFLIKEGMVLEHNGRLTVGPKRTHIGADAPMVIRHHQNWRLQAFNRMVTPNDNNLFYTGPMSLSESVANKIKHQILSMIEDTNKLIIPSPSEVTRCLNIDWFEF